MHNLTLNNASSFGKEVERVYSSLCILYGIYYIGNIGVNVLKQGGFVCCIIQNSQKGL